MLPGQDLIHEHVSELLKKRGLIEPSLLPFAAPVTLDYKWDEGKKSRLCSDFRELNKIIVPEGQPFPLIKDIVQTRNCQWFSSLDINMTFWSISLRVKDRYKTGFTTQKGHKSSFRVQNSFCNIPTYSFWFFAKIQFNTVLYKLYG